MEIVAGRGWIEQYVTRNPAASPRCDQHCFSVPKQQA